MRRVKDRDTSPEIKVRRVLRSAGIGYRLGGCGLPGRPDVVMKGRRIALFVHGCFWHDHDCPRGARKPKGNAAYWAAKIERNHARDIRVAEELTAAGDARHHSWASRCSAEDTLNSPPCSMLSWSTTPSLTSME